VAGVLYYDYLGSFRPRTPGPYHFGPFADIVSLQLQPEFERYMSEAFKPLGVYIDFWGDAIAGALPYGEWLPIRGGASHHFSVVMINDRQEPVEGTLVVSIEAKENPPLISRTVAFQLAAVGRAVYEFDVPIPRARGKYLLTAAAFPQKTHTGPTVCRRKLVVM
jgi:hypothetical protein